MSDVSTTAPEPAEASRPLIQSNWPWLAVRGVLALVFGIIALFSPLAAVYALTFVFGAYALLDGIASIAAGVRHARRREEHWVSLILSGVVGVFAGIAVVIVPWAAAMALVIFTWVMLGLWAFATGVLEFAAGLRLRREIGAAGWLLLLSGAASILLGVGVPVILVINPLAGMVSMGWMMGIYAWLTGILLIALAFTLRRASQS